MGTLRKQITNTYQQFNDKILAVVEPAGGAASFSVDIGVIVLELERKLKVSTWTF